MTSTTSARAIAGSTKLLLAVGATLFTVATLQTAQAQSYEAYVTNDVNILSGPGDDYPPVAALYSGQPVTVYGCLDGYSWCDVQAAQYRGWLDASVLVAAYEGRRVPLYDYGYDIGLPIVTFSFGDYWGHHYRDRPFFAERERFARIPPPVFRGEREHFDHRPGFEQGRPGFDRGPAQGGQGHPEFNRGPNPGDQGRPEFNRGPNPGDQGRPGFDRGQPQPQQGRPEFDRQHGPQFQPQQPQQQRPQFQPQAQPQQRAAPEQRPQPPQPQFQPQAQQHMQGPPSHERYVGPGQPPPQGAPPQAPHPQAAPEMQRPAGPPPGQPHPQGQPAGQPRGDRAHDDHPQ